VYRPRHPERTALYRVMFHTEGGVDRAGVFHKIPRLDDSRLFLPALSRRSCGPPHPRVGRPWSGKFTRKKKFLSSHHHQEQLESRRPVVLHGGELSEGGR